MVREEKDFVILYFGLEESENKEAPFCKGAEKFSFFTSVGLIASENLLYRSRRYLGSPDIQHTISLLIVLKHVV